MKKFIPILALSLAVAAGAISIWHFNKSETSPYVGLEQRKIKSLSEQDIAALREGKGMGYALSAELNGYPGPRHVLDLAGELKLTAKQKSITESLFQKMKTEASVLGEKRIASEAALNDGFVKGQLNEAKLRQLTAASASVDGELRATHLKYHLAMMDVLTPNQVQTYVSLRGYNQAASGHTGH